MKEQSIYYVYVLHRPDGTPFYVGKGCRDRINAHEKAAHKGSRRYVCNVIRKIWASGQQIRKEIVSRNLTNAAAIAMEVSLIARHGRACDGGILVNLTKGGDGATGYKHTSSSLSAMRAARASRPKASAETRAKMRAANLGRVMSDAARQKISEAASGPRHWNYGRTLSMAHKAALHARNRRRVLVDGQEFDSIADAARLIGCASTTLVYRIRMGKPGYQYLTERGER